MIAAMQAAKGFDQKQDGKANDVESENSDAASVDENSDALADMIAAVPLGPHTNPVNGDAVKGDLATGVLAKGAIADPLQNTKSARANMAFEDGKVIQSRHWQFAKNWP